MALPDTFRLPEKALRRIGAACALLLLLFVPALLRGSVAAEGAAPDVARLGVRLREVLLGGPGQPILCPECPSEHAIRVDVASGQATEVPLPYQQVNEIVRFPDGKRVLAATSSDRGKRSLLLVLSADSLAPLGRVEIPGNGERLAIAPDGYSAYVLCHRPGKGEREEPGEGRWQLLVVDLGASAVAETYPLPGPAYDLAVAPGGRLFVAMEDRLQSFTAGPLTASWYYRSPGKNRRIFVRPRRAEIYVLRGPSIAVFDPEPKERSQGEAGGEEPVDDAAQVLDPPAHVDRIGFSDDGRLAAAAGKGIDAIMVLDAEKRRFAGTWPEDSAAIGQFLESLAAAGKPGAPRGKLPPPAPRFDPPLGAPLKPAPPSASAPPPREPSGGPSNPAAGSPMPPVPGREPVSPPSPQATAPPEPSILEEVAEPELSGRITGERDRVASIILFGPNSLTTIQDEVTPSSDGTYSFKLPPRGRYRIVPVGVPGTTLSCRPAFQVVEVAAYGFRGLDFRVMGALGGPPPKR
jgi:hypothetical protein